MIRHMLVFSFRDDVDEESRQALLDGLRQLPTQFPQMHAFELGRNESRRDSSYEYGMTASFDRPEELFAYLDSERHERFVAERFKPLVSRRAIVSFPAPSPGDARSEPGE